MLLMLELGTRDFRFNSIGELRVLAIYLFQKIATSPMGVKMNIWEKRKLIQTEWDNSEESQINFHKAIAELKKENIPYRIVERRMISELTKKGYFIYSLILDTILILGIIWAFFNLDKILN